MTTPNGDLVKVLEARPELVRDIQDLARTPQFGAVKRHVVAAYQELGEEAAKVIAECVGLGVESLVNNFGPDGT